MKTIFCVSFSLIGLIASAVTAVAVSETATRISTSRSLRVACVRDTSEDSPWYVMQQAFATSMSTCLAGKDMTAMPVKMATASATHAAEDLASNECDAVLFIGDSLPSALRDGGFVSLRAVSQIGTPVRVFYFVLRNDDPTMRTALTNAFEKATSSSTFQDTIGRASAMHIVASNGTR
jgi:hypothetical protein